MREIDDYGVHNTHCCRKCGCKYCDDDCPVEFGDAPGIRRQECEYCQSDFEEKIQRNIYAITSRVTGSIFGWIEDPEDFDSVKDTISKAYGISREVLSFYKLDYIGS